MSLVFHWYYDFASQKCKNCAGVDLGVVLVLLYCLIALITFKENAGSGELRISELNFTAGFAERYAPIKKGSIAKCRLGTVKGCMKRDANSEFFSTSPSR